MATMDDKLMGEKRHYYCSSSEDEDDEAPKFVPESAIPAQANGAANVANTGPKGVLEDWRRFKQLERENRDEQEREKAELTQPVQEPSAQASLSVHASPSSQVAVLLVFTAVLVVTVAMVVAVGASHVISAADLLLPVSRILWAPI